MRANPGVFRGHDRVNYLCIAADMLGLDTLAPLPVLVSNYRSVLSHRLVGSADIVVHNLRLLGIMPVSTRMLRMQVTRYNYQHGQLGAGDSEPMHYRIHDDLRFEPTWGEGAEPGAIARAREMLSHPLEQEPQNVPVADPMRPASYSRRQGNTQVGLGLRPIGRTVDPPPRHDPCRKPREIEAIAWDDLVAQAQRFDDIDRQAGRKPTWESRLVDSNAGNRPTVMLKEVVDADTSLRDCDRLVFKGTKHLIGLPGAGKSTILYLIAAILDARGHQAAFFFPSIDVANQFVETLSRYEIGAGLLFGQARQSRSRHVNRMAQRLGQVNGGFAQTSPTARLFATNCALAGFAHDDEHSFPHDEPPCSEVQQVPEGHNTHRRHCCALSGVCGRNLAERELIAHRIWAGHVATTDTRIRPPYSNYKISYFELIARTFDLVVFDEADDAQQNLDEAGSSNLQLWGKEGSVAQLINRDVQATVAGGEGASPNDPAVATHLHYGTQFQSTALWAHQTIASLPEKYRKAYANQLLTTSRLFAALYPPKDDDDDEAVERQYQRQYAIETLWTSGAKAVVFGLRGDLNEDDDERDNERAATIDFAELASTLGIDEEAAKIFMARVKDSLSTWDNSDTEDEKLEASRAITDALLAVSDSHLAKHDYDEFTYLVRLTIAVTLVVLRYMRIHPLLRYWVSTGHLSERTYQRRPSEDLTRVMPESLLGRMAGVRYSADLQAQSGRAGVSIDLVAFVATPRALLYRLSDLYATEGQPGPAVLLTSATSFLEHSPSYHVSSGPHYLLSRPGAKSGWLKSRYRFLALEDPARPDNKLRFSGCPQHLKVAALAKMVDELVRDKHRSVLRREAMRDVVEGVPRRSAFVVNSYEQVVTLVEHIVRNHPSLAGEVRGVIDRMPVGASEKNYVTKSQVESLGSDDEWHVLVFAIGAIGRGVNVVFDHGPRKGEAMIGHVYFLTRPHPTTDSLGFLRGLAGSASMEFDRRNLSGCASFDDLRQAHAAARHTLANRVDRLLRHPLMMRMLNDEMMPWFVADQMIAILQTIGRAMRNDSPAYVYFVDAAWAPYSTAGETDDERSSMLVMMRSILEQLVNHPKVAHAEIYRELYEPFLTPLRDIEDLHSRPRGMLS